MIARGGVFYSGLMMRAGVGHSQQRLTKQAVEEAAAQAMARAEISRADFAMIFFTADHAAHPKDLASALIRSVGTDSVIGSSAAGVLTGDGETEGSSGVAVCAIASDAIAARPFIFEPWRGNEAHLGTSFGDFLAKTDEKNSLMILLPDTYQGNPQPLLASMARRAGFHPVIGAGSSEDGTAGATYQVCGEKVATNAIAGAYISGDFDVQVDITQGCQPIAEPMMITKAEGNLIYEINQRPAMEVFAGLLKGPLREDLRRAVSVIFVGLPANRQENSVAPGQYLVRNIIGVDAGKGIIGIADEVVEGDAMIFAMRDGARAREDLEQMLLRQTAALGNRKPALGIYFNCCARGNSLYGIPGIDSAYIRQALGDIPLVGMFGGYELAPLGRANHLFAYTGVLALISENN